MVSYNHQEVRDLPKNLVLLFLTEFKRCYEKGCVLFGNREKNRKFLQKLGWKPSHALEFLYENLWIQHYYDGPLDEIDPKFSPGIIYVFKINIEEFEVYVKIKKLEDEGFMIVLSFHEAER